MSSQRRFSSAIARTRSNQLGLVRYQAHRARGCTNPGISHVLQEGLLAQSLSSASKYLNAASVPCESSSSAGSRRRGP